MKVYGSWSSPQKPSALNTPISKIKRCIYNPSVGVLSVRQANTFLTNLWYKERCGFWILLGLWG